MDTVSDGKIVNDDSFTKVNNDTMTIRYDACDNVTKIDNADANSENDDCCSQIVINIKFTEQLSEDNVLRIKVGYVTEPCKTNLAFEDDACELNVDIKKPDIIRNLDHATNENRLISHNEENGKSQNVEPQKNDSGTEANDQYDQVTVTKMR